jgi:hypothetical protein
MFVDKTSSQDTLVPVMQLEVLRLNFEEKAR